MPPPRILIPTPTSFDPVYNQQCWEEYAVAIRGAGGEPVRVALTHTPSELEAMAKEADGVLLPGSGADVAAARYGHVQDAASADPDPLREATDWALLEATERADLPLLGICMGLQSMNVFYGGTLIQHVLPVPVNHSAGRAVQAAHTVLVADESRLAAALRDADDFAIGGDSAPRLPVNSSHHQAVAIPGDSLRVVARCPQDGVIEAVEGSTARRWLVGVQWHPERTCSSSAASRSLFRAFVAAASH